MELSIDRQEDLDQPEEITSTTLERLTVSDRRSFLKSTGLTALGAALGMAVPFGEHFPKGLVPAAFAQDTGADLMSEKDGLTVHNDRPLNAETPAHLLDDDITPYSRLFVRANGLVPQSALDKDAAGWTLTIDGEVENELTLTIDDLKSDFEQVTLALVLECGGNGRAFIHLGASGDQRTVGGVG